MLFATPHPNPLPLMGEGAAQNQPPGTHKPFSPQGEKVPEGRMRGGEGF